MITEKDRGKTFWKILRGGGHENFQKKSLTCDDHKVKKSVPPKIAQKLEDKKIHNKLIFK